MIAKLVTHAKTREAAIDLQADALDAFHIDGIQHNIPFLAALMQHPRWCSGQLATGFIAEEYPDGFGLIEPEGEALKVLTCVETVIDHLNNVRRRQITDQMDGAPVTFSLKRVVALGDLNREATVAGSMGGPVTVTLPSEGTGKAETIEVVSDWWPGEPVWQGTVGAKAVSVEVRSMFNGNQLSYRGVSVPVVVYTEREAELQALMPEKIVADMSKFLLCPMPGLVKVVYVEEGQKVSAGDALAVVEAMKMENILRAERDGTVSKVNAGSGDSLAVDEVILEFE